MLLKSTCPPYSVQGSTRLAQQIVSSSGAAPESPFMKPAPSVMHLLRGVPGSNGHPPLFLPFDSCSEHAHQRDRVREHRQRPRSGHGGRELRREAGVSTHTWCQGALAWEQCALAP